MGNPDQNTDPDYDQDYECDPGIKFIPVFPITEKRKNNAEQGGQE